MSSTEQVRTKDTLISRVKNDKTLPSQSFEKNEFYSEKQCVRVTPVQTYANKAVYEAGMHYFMG
jgi:hypothetical protein